jgi:hypothetical protein
MRICRDDKGNEEQSGLVDDKVQMIYERMSTTSSEKDEKKRAYRKSSKVGNHSSGRTLLSSFCYRKFLR